MPIYYKNEMISGTVKEELNAGDGITIQDDTVSVTTPVKGVTQAEYDALSEAEKNTGLYIITDVENQEGFSGDVYSTEETRIGTWIDGKPLYRKVITTALPSKAVDNWQLLSPVIPNILVQSIVAYIRFKSNGSVESIPIVDGQGISTRIRYNPDTTLYHGLEIFMNQPGWVNEPLTVILEYTKTTD